ncbi:MAG: LysR family transcriptional regulator [Gammaproteobacteria bacterium]|nr:LysR family transcriptional regulator [Gammaproteobacteria bacterium]
MMEPIDDMVLFSKLVELRSFTAVADMLHLSRSLVSKRLSRLEDHLGVQLVNRTTRRVELTEAGRTYYQYCVQIENIVQEAETTVSEIRQQPKGNLFINAPVTYGQIILPSIIADFLKKYPAININLSLSDKFVDVVEGGYDIVIRIGQLNDSSLKARKVATTRLVVIAHKNYLKKHGVPKTPQDLQQHNCLSYRYMEGAPNEWQFYGPMGKEVVYVNGNFSAENGVPLYKAAQAGLGIAIQPEFVLEGFDNKGIVNLLNEYTSAELGIYAIYPATRKAPLNTRVFIDFLAEQLSVAAFT